MGRKLVIAVGKAWTGFDGKSVDPRSRASLTDADIILFRPGLGIKADGVAKDRIKFYQRDTAVEVSDTLKHWRSELATAWENGKMLIVWLEKEDTFHVYDPRGSSRDLTSYYPVPFPHPLKLVESHGKIMHLTPSADALSPYWRKFGHLSEYSVYLTEPVGEPLIVTKGAERTVGALLRNKTGGAILLLPPPDLSEATEEVDAAGLGHQLLEAILAIDQALNPREERTPPPGWSTHESFKLHGETDLLSSIESVRKKLQRLTKQQEKLSNEHSEFVQLRWLLYEKGKPLETAVLKAASLLGFKAGEFRDSESEFDVVLESMEARAIGEVQGKDSSAIAISKFRQLQTNILEDFEKRGSDDPAKAVLFGNAYRLEPPESRGEFFTERCLKAAKRFRVALVRTTDLFLAVQYLCRKSDNEFARGCRKAILETEGAVVQFPKPDASP